MTGIIALLLILLISRILKGSIFTTILAISMIIGVFSIGLTLTVSISFIILVFIEFYKSRYFNFKALIKRKTL